MSLVHLSDFHFGTQVDERQVERLLTTIPALAPGAVVLTGDLTQRGRPQEFERAAAFVSVLRETAPTVAIPGNHDVAWWASPFGVRGRDPLYANWRRHFGDMLAPGLEVPGAVIASVLTSHGLAAGSLTWDPRDLSVKGHLPGTETARATEIFRRSDPSLLRVVAMHHNLGPGTLSSRAGLARWRSAARRLRATGADLVLCGHDHQEGIDQIGGTTVVAIAGSHSGRTRGGRPPVFNHITTDRTCIRIQHMRWDADADTFRPGDEWRFARPRR